MDQPSDEAIQDLSARIFELAHGYAPADLVAAWSEFKDVWDFEHSEGEGASIEYRNYLRDVFGAVVDGIDEAIAKTRAE